MRIIPAIDIIEGKCVRLSQGDYSTKIIYNESPIEVAKAYEDIGVNSLHLVDLDGAKSKRIVNWRVLHEIASCTNLSIDFGGGIKSNESIKIAFENGASQITGGSVAIESPDLFKSWIDKYGSDRIILGADARAGKIAINGWEETTSMGIIPFLAHYYRHAVKYVICTDIAKDGMLKGTSNAMYRSILSEFPNFKLIASGGVAGVSDLDKLKQIGVEGVVIGKAIYEGRIKLKQLTKYVN